MPVLQTAMAVLSGGPYGVADIAGTMNRSLVMRSCRSDGVLLRPSWPATAVDASFVHSFHSLKPLYLWTAHSLVGAHQFSLVLSINLEEPTTMTVSDICGGGSAVASNVVVFEAWHGLERAGGVRRMRRSDPFTLPPTPERSPYIAGHSLWAVAPVLAGNWSFLGEPSKIVKASGRRVERLSSDGQRLTARLLLAPREAITVAVLSPAGEVLRADCVAKGEGAVVAYGDRDVALALSCEGAYCLCA